MMNSREEILKAVRRNKPEPTPLPEISNFDRPDLDVEVVFERMVLQMGGSFKRLISKNELGAYISENYKDKKMIVSNVEGFQGTHPLSSISHALELETVDLAVLNGGIAVAENAAIWVSNEAIGYRALPFICEHLVLVFERKNLVYNMHQAYEALTIAHINYGVFIAGPSKTADIEQSLVIGAHGPKSLLAVMVS
jgi:L-lactate dehydrogenase complex protein LldG